MITYINCQISAILKLNQGKDERVYGTLNLQNCIYSENIDVICNGWILPYQQPRQKCLILTPILKLIFNPLQVDY